MIYEEIFKEFESGCVRYLCNPIDFEEAYKRKVVMAVGGIKMNVVSIDDLVKIKSSAGRPRDMEDINHLEIIMKLKKEDL